MAGVKGNMLLLVIVVSNEQVGRSGEGRKAVSLSLLDCEEE